MELVETARRWGEDVQERYEHGSHRPLGGYLGVMGAYGALVGAGTLAARAAGVRLPDRVSAADIALGALATHRLARLLTKDAVTSPLRAPFAEYEGSGLPAEVNEKVDVPGWRHAVGELVTCPFCLGQWVATAFVGGIVVAPRATRAVGAVFATAAVADLLQYVHASLAHAAE